MRAKGASPKQSYTQFLKVQHIFFLPKTPSKPVLISLPTYCHPRCMNKSRFVRLPSVCLRASRSPGERRPLLPKAFCYSFTGFVRIIFVYLISMYYWTNLFTYWIALDKWNSFFWIVCRFLVCQIKLVRNCGFLKLYTQSKWHWQVRV